MKLCFPGQDHLDCVIKDEQLTVGGAAGCDIRLPGLAGSDISFRFVHDNRGLVLELTQPGADAVRVNGREVRSLAILRAGDELSVAECPIRICADAAPLQMLPEGYADVPDSSEESGDDLAAAAKLGLRCVSASHDGQLFGIRGKTVISNRGGAAIALATSIDVSATVFAGPSGIFLLVDEGSAPVLVNGYPVSCSSLEHGDQVQLGDDRFLLEAPGFVPVLKPTDSQTFVLHGLPTAAARDASPVPPPRRSRDNIIIAVCLIVSTCLLLLLAMRL